ncbi:hypothetical protein C1H46_010377 [Malus baccata]|uniref:Uncharacterized protein n=1 Tax=Malus baccata TaxID=106549 RepID=A0A540MYY2_MALBA|nr:hypothetical protein C1H46_010377 [Malus baccata]
MKWARLTRCKPWPPNMPPTKQRKNTRGTSPVYRSSREEEDNKSQPKPALQHHDGSDNELNSSNVSASGVVAKSHEPEVVLLLQKQIHGWCFGTAARAKNIKQRIKV